MLVSLRDRWLAAALLVTALATTARAQDEVKLKRIKPDRKTDVVVLTNGDRFTGEIKSLSKGQLSLDMSSTGLVSIKWVRVAELTSLYLYEVETEGGERLLGSLAPNPPGALLVASGGGAPRSVPIMSVVRLNPIGQSFFKRLDGSIDLGGSYTQSSGVAQGYVNYSMRARRPAFEWNLAFDDYITVKDDGATSEQLSTSFSYARNFAPRWAVFGTAMLERNPDLGFDLRSTLVGGVEWSVLRSNRSEIVVGAGLGTSRERPLDGETTTQVPALFAFRQSLFIYDTPKTTLDTQVTAYPILNESGRWRLKADASVKREIVRHFTVAFTFYESFDSRPSSDARRNDVGTTFSVGYTF